MTDNKRNGTLLFECQELCVGYDGKAVAENLNFSVNRGDYICVVGQNGSGKSTLIKTLLGLEKPVSGKISGVISPKQIGYMPQSTEQQKDFPATVKEIVLSGVLGQKGVFSFYSLLDRKLAKESMDKMGIRQLERKQFGELSGGQRQRVLLARALSAAKDIILLDEPCAGLDVVTTTELYSLIEKLNKSGVTVIMVTHDMEAAMKYSNRILCLCKTPFFGTSHEYLHHMNGGGTCND